MLTLAPTPRLLKDSLPGCLAGDTNKALHNAAQEAA
jgi:hypothetical protein